MNYPRCWQHSIVFLFALFSFQLAFSEGRVRLPEHPLTHIQYEIEVLATHDSVSQVHFTLNGKTMSLNAENGKASFPYTFQNEEELHFVFEQTEETHVLNPIPLWMSLIPPLLAILMALLFKEVISSLFVGILFGALTIHLYDKGLAGILYGFMAVGDTYLLGALNDWGHQAVILFSTLIGGMVAVISRNGGMHGVVDLLSKYAKNARSSQLVTWFMGVLIFFDDYANTLIVGNTMRPLTDRYKISREKLSYLVDSTAAPIAAIAFVTTWIGAELGYIEDGIKNIGQINEGAYTIFLNSLPFSFYPVFTLLFMLMLVVMKRDFGPMLKAERKARRSDKIEEKQSSTHHEIATFQPAENTKRRWYNALIPVSVMILGTLLGLLYTGWNADVVANQELSFFRKLSVIIGGSDSYLALTWSSMFGLIIAILLSVSQRIMNLEESLSTALSGFKTMLNAIVILVLAWSLAKLTEDLHTADFLTNSLSDNLPATWIPATTFLLAALVAFATGSSWGTMAILYPLMLPATWSLGMEAGLEQQTVMVLFYNVVASVLAGSVLGDHCSPISDTTILSSLATSCDHIQHVRTQMPYALCVGAVSICIGTIPASFGIPPIWSFITGITLLFLLVYFLGKPTEEKA